MPNTDQHITRNTAYTVAEAVLGRRLRLTEGVKPLVAEAAPEPRKPSAPGTPGGHKGPSL